MVIPKWIFLIVAVVLSASASASDDLMTQLLRQVTQEQAESISRAQNIARNYLLQTLTVVRNRIIQYNGYNTIVQNIVKGLQSRELEPLKIVKDRSFFNNVEPPTLRQLAKVIYSMQGCNEATDYSISRWETVLAAIPEMSQYLNPMQGLNIGESEYEIIDKMDRPFVNFLLTAVYYNNLRVNNNLLRGILENYEFHPYSPDLVPLIRNVNERLALNPFQDFQLEPLSGRMASEDVSSATLKRILSSIVVRSDLESQFVYQIKLILTVLDSDLLGHSPSEDDSVAEWLTAMRQGDYPEDILEARDELTGMLRNGSLLNSIDLNTLREDMIGHSPSGRVLGLLGRLLVLPPSDPAAARVHALYSFAKLQDLARSESYFIPRSPADIAFLLNSFLTVKNQVNFGLVQQINEIFVSPDFDWNALYRDFDFSKYSDPRRLLISMLKHIGQSYKLPACHVIAIDYFLQQNVQTTCAENVDPLLMNQLVASSTPIVPVFTASGDNSTALASAVIPINCTNGPPVRVVDPDCLIEIIDSTQHAAFITDIIKYNVIPAEKYPYNTRYAVFNSILGDLKTDKYTDDVSEFVISQAILRLPLNDKANLPPTYKLLCPEEIEMIEMNAPTTQAPASTTPSSMTPLRTTLVIPPQCDNMTQVVDRDSLWESVNTTYDWSRLRQVLYAEPVFYRDYQTMNTKAAILGAVLETRIKNLNSRDMDAVLASFVELCPFTPNGQLPPDVVFLCNEKPSYNLPVEFVTPATGPVAVEVQGVQEFSVTESVPTFTTSSPYTNTIQYMNTAETRFTQKYTDATQTQPSSELCNPGEELTLIVDTDALLKLLSAEAPKARFLRTRVRSYIIPITPEMNYTSAEMLRYVLDAIRDEMNEPRVTANADILKGYIQEYGPGSERPATSYACLPNAAKITQLRYQPQFELKDCSHNACSPDETVASVIDTDSLFDALRPGAWKNPRVADRVRSYVMPIDPSKNYKKGDVLRDVLRDLLKNANDSAIERDVNTVMSDIAIGGAADERPQTVSVCFPKAYLGGLPTSQAAGGLCVLPDVNQVPASVTGTLTSSRSPPPPSQPPFVVPTVAMPQYSMSYPPSAVYYQPSTIPPTQNPPAIYSNPGMFYSSAAPPQSIVTNGPLFGISPVFPGAPAAAVASGSNPGSSMFTLVSPSPSPLTTQLPSFPSLGQSPNVDLSPKPAEPAVAAASDSLIHVEPSPMQGLPSIPSTFPQLMPNPQNVPESAMVVANADSAGNISPNQPPLGVVGTSPPAELPVPELSQQFYAPAGTEGPVLSVDTGISASALPIQDAPVAYPSQPQIPQSPVVTQSPVPAADAFNPIQSPVQGEYVPISPAQGENVPNSPVVPQQANETYPQGAPVAASASAAVADVNGTSTPSSVTQNMIVAAPSVLFQFVGLPPNVTLVTISSPAPVSDAPHTNVTPAPFDLVPQDSPVTPPPVQPVIPEAVQPQPMAPVVPAVSQTSVSVEAAPNSQPQPVQPEITQPGSVAPVPQEPPQAEGSAVAVAVNSAPIANISPWPYPSEPLQPGNPQPPPVIYPSPDPTAAASIATSSWPFQYVAISSSPSVPVQYPSSQSPSDSSNQFAVSVSSDSNGISVYTPPSYPNLGSSPSSQPVQPDYLVPSPSPVYVADHSTVGNTSPWPVSYISVSPPSQPGSPYPFSAVVLASPSPAPAASAAASSNQNSNPLLPAQPLQPGAPQMPYENVQPSPSYPPPPGSFAASSTTYPLPVQDLSVSSPFLPQQPVYFQPSGEAVPPSPAPAGLGTNPSPFAQYSSPSLYQPLPPQQSAYPSYPAPAGLAAASNINPPSNQQVFVAPQAQPPPALAGPAVSLDSPAGTGPQVKVEGTYVASPYQPQQTNSIQPGSPVQAADSGSNLPALSAPVEPNIVQPSGEVVPPSPASAGSAAAADSGSVVIQYQNEPGTPQSSLPLPVQPPAQEVVADTAPNTYSPPVQDIPVSPLQPVVAQSPNEFQTQPSPPVGSGVAVAPGDSAVPPPSQPVQPDPAKPPILAGSLISPPGNNQSPPPSFIGQVQGMSPNQPQNTMVDSPEAQSVDVAAPVNLIQPEMNPTTLYPDVTNAGPTMSPAEVSNESTTYGSALDAQTVTPNPPEVSTPAQPVLPTSTPPPDDSSSSDSRSNGFTLYPFIRVSATPGLYQNSHKIFIPQESQAAAAAVSDGSAPIGAAPFPANGPVSYGQTMPGSITDLTVRDAEYITKTPIFPEHNLTMSSASLQGNDGAVQVGAQPESSQEDNTHEGSVGMTATGENLIRETTEIYYNPTEAPEIASIVLNASSSPVAYMHPGNSSLPGYYELLKWPILLRPEGNQTCYDQKNQIQTSPVLVINITSLFEVVDPSAASEVDEYLTATYLTSLDTYYKLSDFEFWNHNSKEEFLRSILEFLLRSEDRHDITEPIRRVIGLIPETSSTPLQLGALCNYRIYEELPKRNGNFTFRYVSAKPCPSGVIAYDMTIATVAEPPKKVKDELDVFTGIANRDHIFESIEWATLPSQSDFGQLLMNALQTAPADVQQGFGEFSEYVRKEMHSKLWQTSAVAVQTMCYPTDGMPQVT